MKKLLSNKPKQIKDLYLSSIVFAIACIACLIIMTCFSAAIPKAEQHYDDTIRYISTTQESSYYGTHTVYNYTIGCGNIYCPYCHGDTFQYSSSEISSYHYDLFYYYNSHWACFWSFMGMGVGFGLVSIVLASIASGIEDTNKRKKIFKEKHIDFDLMFKLNRTGNQKIWFNTINKEFEFKNKRFLSKKYNVADIKEILVLQNEEIVAQGANMGGMLAGGALFGALGAVAGSMIPTKKKGKKIIRNEVRIELDDPLCSSVIFDTTRDATFRLATTIKLLAPELFIAQKCNKLQDN